MKKLSQEQIAAYVIDIVRETINNIYGQEPTEQEEEQIKEADEVLKDECYEYIQKLCYNLQDNIMADVDELIREIDTNEEKWQREEDEEEVNED